MVVPRFDLAVTTPALLAAARAVVTRQGAADSGALRRFESDLAAWLGPDQSAVFVPSARSGLYLILDGLRRLGRIAADRRLVVMPAWTHESVLVVVRAAGFTPWFVDCNPNTLNADADGVPPEVWPHTAAAIVTHLYGTPAETVGWVRHARAHGVAVIEDCAQGLGARTPDGQRCGAQGDASYYSFQLTKNFTTLGGGAVTTRDADLAALLAESVVPRPSRPDRSLLVQIAKGLAFRLATRPLVFGATVYPALRAGWALTGRDRLHDAFEEQIHFSPPRGLMPAPAAAQADLGRRQLPALDAANARRTAAGTRLRALLEGIPGVTLPSWPEGSQPIFMSFVLRVPRRMAFMHELLKHGVDSSPGYLRACHRLDGDVASGPAVVPQADCPHAERLEKEQVHLPIYPRLGDREVEQIARAVRAAARKLGLEEARPIAPVPIMRG